MGLKAIFEEKVDRLQSLGVKPRPTFVGLKVIASSEHLLPYDAVSSQVIDWGALAHVLGAEVIMAAHEVIPFHDGLVRARKEVFQSAPKDSLLMTQFSAGDEHLPRDHGLKTFCFFHGITPANLLRSSNPAAAQACEEGIEQIATLPPFAGLAFNSLESQRQWVKARGPISSDAAILPPYLLLQGRPTSELARPRDPFHLLNVGRVTAHKNQAELLRWFGELHRLDSRYRLTICGAAWSSSYLDELRNWVETEKLTNSVRWIPDIPESDLREMMASAGCLVSMSLHEGFGIPFVEAFRAGLPVAARPVAAVPEILDGAAFYFDDQGIAANAESFHRWMTSDDASKCASRGRRLFEEKYADHIVVDKTIQAWTCWLGKERPQ